jgi:hypothetical protein
VCLCKTQRRRGVEVQLLFTVRYPLNRRFCGLRSRSRPSREETNIRSRSPGPPARSLVTTPTAEQLYVTRCQQLFLNTAIFTVLYKHSSYFERSDLHNGSEQAAARKSGIWRRFVCLKSYTKLQGKQLSSQAFYLSNRCTVGLL